MTTEKICILLEKVSSHDEPCSEGCKPKILEGISLGTKRYDRVLKLRHNAVKQKKWIFVHMTLKGTDQQNSKI